MVRFFLRLIVYTNQLLITSILLVLLLGTSKNKPVENCWSKRIYFRLICYGNSLKICQWFVPLQRDIDCRYNQTKTCSFLIKTSVSNMLKHVLSYTSCCPMIHVWMSLCRVLCEHSQPNIIFLANCGFWTDQIIKSVNTTSVSAWTWFFKQVP